jgi:hypothetical protein
MAFIVLHFSVTKDTAHTSILEDLLQQIREPIVICRTVSLAHSWMLEASCLSVIPWMCNPDPHLIGMGLVAQTEKHPR